MTADLKELKMMKEDIEISRRKIENRKKFLQKEISQLNKLDKEYFETNKRVCDLIDRLEEKE